MFEKSGSFRSFVDLRRYGLSPTLTFTPNTQTRINLSFEDFHDGRTADRGIPSFQGRPADVEIDTFFGNPDQSYVRASVDLLSATIQHQAGRLSIRNRTMFARCVQKTNSATTRLIANKGDRTPTVTPSRIGRTVALVSEPSETKPLESSTTTNIDRAKIVCIGASARNTPPAVATPFPPRPNMR